jgi:NADH-quinone oxidoreductase subunit C
LEIIEISKLLIEKFSDSIEFSEDSTFIKVQPKQWEDIALFIKDDNKLKFDYLMCISSYDCGNKETYGVAYNFKSTSIGHELELRIEVNDKESIPSVAHLWGAADWHEREAYDMIGIKFDNHPNFKRILLSDDWVGHPLRKDYETPDYYRGMPVPKDKTYWE